MNILRNNISFLSIVIIIILISLTNSCKLFHPDDDEDKQTTYKIAFLRDRDPDNALYNDNDLWIIDIDGTNETQLTSDINIANFIFSPNGQKICFEVSLNEELNEPLNFSDLYLINSDGSELHKIPNSEGYMLSHLHFTPSGDKLVFEIYLQPNYYPDIFTMNIDGTQLTNLTNTDTLGEDINDITPDGTQILFTRWKRNAPLSDLYLIDSYGNVIDCINCDDPNFYSFNPIFSRDGAAIYFWGGERYVGEDRWNNGSMFVTPFFSMNIDGSDIKTIWEGPALTSYSDFQLAPNDEFILYRILSDFYRIDIDGENEIQLTSGFENCFAPDISYNGEYITFSECNDLSCGIYVMDSDGNNLKLITEGFYPRFQPIP